MDPIRVIARNYAWHDDFDEQSFTGELNERQVWNLDEYWLLETALYKLAEAGAPSPELAWWIFRIFSHTFMSVSAHLDSNDVFVIKNLSSEDFYDFRERIQVVFEGFFSGDMPEQSSFDLQNPLLVS
jgi:hypothetical protein